MKILPLPENGADHLSRRRSQGIDPFERFFRDHVDGVRRYVVHHLYDVDIEEVLSETFVVAWRRFDRIPIGKQRAWLIGVARNVARNARRSSRRRTRLSTECLARAEIPLAAEHSRSEHPSSESVLRAIQRLPEHEREVLLLQAWQELSATEIAHVVNTTKRTVNRRLARARERLRTDVTSETE